VRPSVPATHPKQAFLNFNEALPGANATYSVFNTFNCSNFYMASSL
jgi:hypothetical protein